MRTTRAVSNAVFGVTVVVLLVIAVAGFGLYATSSSAKTVTSTTTVMASNATAAGVSGGFLGAKVVGFSYPTPYDCAPPTGQLFPNQTAAAAKAPCEAGANGTLLANSLPVWTAVPAFAGLSIFGVTALGASPQGFAVYHNQTILTDCGAGGTVNACPQHPTYLYSPAFTAVEQHLNITTGYGGLPEGVLPTPDHDHIIDSAAGGANIPWDVITVLVFDPNILPNPVTGACSQVVPSSLTNATANCLTSLSALQAAFATSNPDIAAANAGNPIWQTLGGPTTQVVIPGDSAVSQINNDNGNLNVYFAVGNSSPYPPTQSLAGAVGLIAAVSLLGLVAWRRAELTNLVTGRGGKRPDSAAEMKSG